MTTILYCLEETWQNVWSQKMLTFITAMVVSISLSIPAFFLLFYDNLEKLVQSFRGNIHLSIYLDDDITDAEAESLRNRISSEKGVRQVIFTTKKEAREEFETMGFDSLFVDQTDGNPFPASFTVGLAPKAQNDEQYLSQLAKRLGKVEGIEEVRYRAEWLSSLNLVLGKLRTTGLFIGIVLGAVVVTMVSATIRLNYYKRQAEMEILQLLGASRKFIRVPYLLEGFFLGAVASAFSMLFLRSVYAYLEERLLASGNWLGMSYHPQFFHPSSIGLFLLCGSALGILGSYISLIFTEHG